MDVYDAARSRRAVRAFTDRPASKEALCPVLSAAAWTGRTPLDETVTFVA